MRGIRIRLAAAALGLSCMGAGGVGCTPRATEAEFDSANPAAKLYAIQKAGQKRDADKIPALIEQLNSDDPAVRMYAIIALEKITGTRLNYSPYDPPWRRANAIERWAAAYRGGRLAGAERSSDVADRADEPPGRASSAPPSAASETRRE